ncbi:MAG: hypothetical protein ACOVKO_03955 [Elstera sp.]
MPNTTGRGGGRRWVGRLSLALCGLLPLVALAASLNATPGTREPVAVLFPPTYSAADTLNALALPGVRLVAPGGIASIFIVQSDDPSLLAQLSQAGAWLVLNSTAAALCAS